MTDLEEVPEDPTPLRYERLPDLKPVEHETDVPSEPMKKVLGSIDPDTDLRKGGLRD